MTSNAVAPSLRLYILHTGYVPCYQAPFVMPNGEMEYDTANWFSGCYLLQHPQGWLLWDTGIQDAKISAPSGETTDTFRFVVTKTLLSSLLDLNLTPQDITFVALSHAHGDHVGNLAQFVTSALIVHGREYEAQMSLVPPAGLAPEDRKVFEKSDTIRLTADYDVFGDGSVMILEAPGHTVGHQVLLAQLPKTGPVLLAGDLYYSPRDRAEKRIPTWNSSQEQTLQSRERIEKVLDDTHALLIIHHDLEQHVALPQSPAFLE